MISPNFSQLGLRPRRLRIKRYHARFRAIMVKYIYIYIYILKDHWNLSTFFKFCFHSTKMSLAILLRDLNAVLSLFILFFLTVWSDKGFNF